MGISLGRVREKWIEEFYPQISQINTD